MTLVCACGCGQPVQPRLTTGAPRLYATDDCRRVAQDRRNKARVSLGRPADTVDRLIDELRIEDGRIGAEG